MTLPQNGLPISLKQIADEFQDTAPHSLSEFYGQGGVTSSGVIDFDDFYGKSRAFIFNKTISSNTQEYNLRNDLLANGWNSNSIDPVEATITINSGVYVWSNSTSTAGFTIGTLPAGSTVNIINNGYIMGKGGNGGSGTGQYSASSGSSGGPAININFPISITNNSYIGGGGGGGGGAWAAYGTAKACGGGGGAGGASGGSGAWMTNSSRPAGGSGGAPGAKGSNAAAYAGGGGGRIMPGVRTTAYSQGGEAGGAGARSFGSASYGYGGAGGEAGGSEVNDGQLPRNSGGGGGWGSSGGTGYPGIAGGSGGKCINLNGNTVTWVVTGTRYGAIS